MSTLEPKWERTVADETGTTQQYISPRDDGVLIGWEVYDNGHISDPVEVGTTLPLGFTRIQDGGA